uniref:Cyclic nucleotide-binding domain-containing protein n=1 Tax=Chromera velia CCMP2878 TaxID=1169474 RepID=A0A0G4HFM3_9ALVE|eukprot:Cvel_6676.t1-p1 / transcript=Cvel_6676.t1 / gene=Cvel_6676 / organism=Chromera_velia_CCMP2878 / gene_product=hypothetical protein / transcript_product=hypothetical protein / location=Cvel_scaffold332:766-12898(+) / protein_length=1047 / sequence_SO=supercontig / SO=protein_coding / is_pseudo=false
MSESGRPADLQEQPVDDDSPKKGSPTANAGEKPKLSIHQVDDEKRKEGREGPPRDSPTVRSAAASSRPVSPSAPTLSQNANAGPSVKLPMPSPSSDKEGEEKDNDKDNEKEKDKDKDAAGKTQRKIERAGTLTMSAISKQEDKKSDLEIAIEICKKRTAFEDTPEMTAWEMQMLMQVIKTNSRLMDQAQEVREDICREFRYDKRKKGQVVFYQGDIPNDETGNLYLILSGKVEVRAKQILVLNAQGQGGAGEEEEEEEDLEEDAEGGGEGGGNRRRSTGVDSEGGGPRSSQGTLLAGAGKSPGGHAGEEEDVRSVGGRSAASGGGNTGGGTEGRRESQVQLSPEELEKREAEKKRRAEEAIARHQRKLERKLGKKLAELEPGQEKNPNLKEQKLYFIREGMVHVSARKERLRFNEKVAARRPDWQVIGTLIKGNMVGYASGLLDMAEPFRLIAASSEVKCYYFKIFDFEQRLPKRPSREAQLISILDSPFIRNKVKPRTAEQLAKLLSHFGEWQPPHQKQEPVPDGVGEGDPSQSGEQGSKVMSASELKELATVMDGTTMWRSSAKRRQQRLQTSQSKRENPSGGNVAKQQSASNNDNMSPGGGGKYVGALFNEEGSETEPTAGGGADSRRVSLPTSACADSPPVPLRPQTNANTNSEHQQPPFAPASTLQKSESTPDCLVDRTNMTLGLKGTGRGGVSWTSERVLKFRRTFQAETSSSSSASKSGGGGGILWGYSVGETGSSHSAPPQHLSPQMVLKTVGRPAYVSVKPNPFVRSSSHLRETLWQRQLTQAKKDFDVLLTAQAAREKDREKPDANSKSTSHSFGNITQGSGTMRHSVSSPNIGTGGAGAQGGVPLGATLGGEGLGWTGIKSGRGGKDRAPPRVAGGTYGILDGASLMRRLNGRFACANFLSGACVRGQLQQDILRYEDRRLREELFEKLYIATRQGDGEAPAVEALIRREHDRRLNYITGDPRLKPPWQKGFANNSRSGMRETSQKSHSGGGRGRQGQTAGEEGTHYRRPSVPQTSSEIKRESRKTSTTFLHLDDD